MSIDLLNIIGIDYGSKLAGTTVIAHLKNQQICLFQSQKKKDADRFIFEYIQKNPVSSIFLDAPLSLPKVYQFPDQNTSYFYRKADQTLKAMSPMFLGGLTARAMQLKAKITQEVNASIPIYECYPSALAREVGLKALDYKKEKARISDNLAHLQKQEFFDYSIEEKIENWHQFDALLALYTGIRHYHKTHLQYGDEKEGLIFV